MYFFEILSLEKLITFYKVVFLWSREDPFYKNKHTQNDTNKKYSIGKIFNKAQNLRRRISSLERKVFSSTRRFSYLFYSSKNPGNLIAVALIKGTKYSRIAQVKFVEDSL